MKIDVEINYVYNKILDITKCYYISKTKTLYIIYIGGVHGNETWSSFGKIPPKYAEPFVDLVNEIIKK